MNYMFRDLKSNEIDVRISQATEKRIIFIAI